MNRKCDSGVESIPAPFFYKHLMPPASGTHHAIIYKDLTAMPPFFSSIVAKSL